MNRAHATPIDIALNGEATAPDWVQLLPTGPDIVGIDGRRWTLRDPQTLVAAFNRTGRALPLDWEHATQTRGEEGLRADVAGWIEELTVRNGQLWGRVAWTDRGRESVASRGYRYISPVFVADKASAAIERMLGAGLVHLPNLDLAALNRTEPLTPEIVPMDKIITEALGLVADASAASVVTAINALKAEKVTALNRAEKPDPEKFVPKKDFDLAMNRLGTFEEKEKEALEASITSTVDAVIAAGDPAFPPANRDEFLAMCRQEGGLERFRKIAKPQLDKALNTAVLDGKKPQGGGNGLTAEEIAVCRQTGTSEADYIAAKKEQEAAGLV